MCYNLEVVSSRRTRLVRSPWLCIALLAALLPSAAGAAAPVGVPKVSGPRSTVLERPQYRFRAKHAVSFRCAFDAKRLHACRARFSQKLFPGKHTLRVRAVGKHRALSRLVTVKVVVKVAYPRLAVASPIQVGAGAGVPAAAGGRVWVPDTETGDLERVDPAAGSVTHTTHVGSPAPGGGGYLDSAAAGGSIWSASDAGGTIARVDAASGAETSTIQAGSRRVGSPSAEAPSGRSASRDLRSHAWTPRQAQSGRCLSRAPAQPGSPMETARSGSSASRRQGSSR